MEPPLTEILNASCTCNGVPNAFTSKTIYLEPLLYVGHLSILDNGQVQVPQMQNTM